MKRSTRNNLISLACTLSLVAIGGGVALKANHAKADELNLTNSMVASEAQLRVKTSDDDQTGNGLRFVVEAAATTLPEGATKTGTLVIPTALLVGELTVDTEHVYDFDTTADWNVYEDSACSFAYFWNMSEYSYNVELAYRGYVVIAGDVYYTNVETTSLAEVALDAVQHGDTAAEEYLLDYTVTYDVEGDEDPTESVKYGDKAQNAPVALVKEGYTFNGWLLDGEPFDVENTAIKGDITLVADWEVATYSVAFKNVDGSAVKTETVQHGNTVVAPSCPVLEGYTEFLGWYTEDGAEFDASKAITVDTVVVAKAKVGKVFDFTTMQRIPSELINTTKAQGEWKYETHFGVRTLKINWFNKGIDIKIQLGGMTIPVGTTISITMMQSDVSKSNIAEGKNFGWFAAKDATGGQLTGKDIIASSTEESGYVTTTLTAKKELVVDHLTITTYAGSNSPSLWIKSIEIETEEDRLAKLWVYDEATKTYTLDCTNANALLAFGGSNVSKMKHTEADGVYVDGLWGNDNVYIKLPFALPQGATVTVNMKVDHLSELPPSQIPNNKGEMGSDGGGIYAYNTKNVWVGGFSKNVTFAFGQFADYTSGAMTADGAGLYDKIWIKPYETSRIGFNIYFHSVTITMP